MISWLDLWRKDIVFAAGMQRSGSTLLYNIIRLILTEKWNQKLYTTWIDDYKDNNYSIVLVKNHSMTYMQYWLTKHVFFSYRDIRAVVYSNYKTFNQVPSLDFCRQQIQQYKMAKKHKAYLFSFEALNQDTKNQIEKIATILQVDVNVDSILNKIPTSTNSIESYDKKTLLHPNHIQNISSLDWQNNLDKTLIADINTTFSDWFKEVNYVI